VILLSVDQGLTLKYWSKVCRDSFNGFHASKLWM